MVLYKATFLFAKVQPRFFSDFFFGRVRSIVAVSRLASSQIGFACLPVVADLPQHGENEAREEEGGYPAA
jgi:hypothetical protein